MQQERDALVFISEDAKILSRFKMACEFLQVEMATLKSLHDFSADDKFRPRSLVLDLETDVAQSEEVLSKIRRSLPKLNVIFVVEDPLSAAEKLKLAGYKTPYVVQRDQLVQTFLLEFLLFQKGLCEFYEIQATDLFPDTMVYFNAYHYLPLNQKYFPLVLEDFVLTEKKYKKIEAIKSLYLDYESTAPYAQYIEKYFDQFNVGLKKRAKSKVYQLISAWRKAQLKSLYSLETVSTITDEEPDFGIWLNDVLNYARSAPDAWSLFFDFSHLPAFRFESSCFVLMVASYFSRYFGQDELERIMNVQGMIASARLSVDPLLYKKWLLSRGAGFSEDEKKIWNEVFVTYQKTPQFLATSEEAQKDFLTYYGQFVAKQNTSLQEAPIVHIYWAELMAFVFGKASQDDFKRQDLLEEVVVHCKSDGILNEAWVEELRQILLKEAP